MDKLRVGIIGTGGIAQSVHIPGYQKLEDVEVVACCDILPERVEEGKSKFGIPTGYLDYTEMLAKEKLDIVSVCTPNYRHMAPTLAALEAGCNVLTEKPIAVNAVEGQKMVDTAKKVGKKFCVGLNNRQTSEAQALKRAIDAGELGEMYFARAQALRRRGIPGWGVFGEKDKQGGGPLIDIGVHILDLTLWLMGHPKPIAVSGQTYQKFGKREGIVGLFGQWNRETFTVEDFAVGLVRFDNGATLVLESSFAANLENDIFSTQIMGTEGGCTLAPCRIYTERNMTLLDTSPAHLPNIGTHAENIRKFVEAVKTDGEVPVPGEQALMVTKILDAIYASAEAGKEVPVA
ncbi:MAG TPA: Gfo/Idh/MocA family oxidoreductase [Armatimonadota bacterium]